MNQSPLRTNESLMDNSQTGETRPNTLDEPISETLKRDLRLIGTKIRYVMFPAGETENKLRDWDLWGPLLLCLCLSLSASWTMEDESVEKDKETKGLVFIMVFVVVGFGSIVITINAMLLGGKVAMLNDSIAPWINIIIVAVALVWCIRAALMFMGDLVSHEKRGLAVYPICLFYCFLGWVILHWE